MKKKNKLIGSNIELIIKETTVTTNDGDTVIISGYANKYLDDNGKLVIDRSEEAVLPQGYDLTNYEKNPILLYSHDATQPIGKIINIDVRVEGLYIEAEVHKVMNEKVYYGVKNGILKTFSIGFKVKDYAEVDGVYLWTATELFEVSIVAVPDNQDSLFSVLTDAPCQSGVCLLGSKAISKDTITKERVKAVTKKWSEIDKQALKGDLLALATKSVIDDAYLVVKDASDSTTWKFPHHDLVGDNLILNKGGVISAFSALKGVQGDDILSVKEKLVAATHLQAHFIELHKDALVDDSALDNINEYVTNLRKTTTEDDMKTKNGNESPEETPEQTPEETPEQTPEETPEQTPEETTINTQEETEKDSKTQNPNTGESGEPSDSKPKMGLDDVMSFIGTAKTSQEGVEQLFVLYAEVADTLNEVLSTD